MTDRPLVLSADQVRAYLAGKTQDRVVLEPQPPNGCGLVGIYAPGLTAVFNPSGNQSGSDPDRDWSARLASIGDRFWVREDFGSDGSGPTLYPATDDMTGADRMLPAVAMPLSASRLTLIVTDVRVQRLREISEEDAEAEGVNGGCRMCGEDAPCECPTPTPDHVEGFIYAWNARHPNPAHQWAANPWVEARTFRVVNRNINEVK